MAKPDNIKKGRRNAQQLLQNDKFEEALLKLEEGGEESEKAKKNPRQWLKDQGVQVPGNPDTVEIEEGSWTIKLCWSEWCVSFTWH